MRTNEVRDAKDFITKENEEALRKNKNVKHQESMKYQKNNQGRGEKLKEIV